MESRSITSLFALVQAVALSFAPPVIAQETPQRVLLGLSKTAHTLAIIDPKDLKVMGRVAVGPDPHEVIASTDEKTAYVSNTGSGRFHEINVIDINAKKALANIDSGALIGPHGLAFADGRLWFTAEGSKSVARYNPATSQVDWILGTGQDRTHMLHVDSDGKKIITTNVDSGTVSILENVMVPSAMPPIGVVSPGAKPHAEWLETVIPASKGSEGFDISPDGKELWTAAAGDGTIFVIDIATKKVSSTIDAKVVGANRLKFTPDGKKVFVSSLRNGDLVVYDSATRKEVKRINIGKGAAGILMDTKSSRAFVSCTPDDYVAVIDLDKLEISGHIDIGGHPDGLAWSLDN